MRKHNLLLIITLVFTLSLNSSAQLSENAIDEVANQHVDKWAQFFSLSNYRKAELKKSWKKHELSKSRILLSTNNIKDRLKEENEKYLESLKSFLTPSEFKFYTNYEATKMADDKAYLASLVEAISMDSVFIDAYSDLHYNKILPFQMSVRMNLEEDINRSDRRVLDSIRSQILDIYDRCLVTCILDNHDHDNLHEDFDRLLLVALNKDLDNSESAISKLLKLTKKYEDSIHKAYISNKEKFNYWENEKKKLKQHYILDSYNKSLSELRKRDDLSSLKHLEEEAIFLLFDPYNVHLSRKFLNLNLYNEL